jgi:hypothetical protein
MVEDDMGSKTIAHAIGVEEGIDQAQPVIEDVGQAHGHQRCLAARMGRVFVAVFDDPRAHRRLLDHRGEFEHIHVGHAAIGMARIEVAAEERILRLGGPGRPGQPTQPLIAL